MSVNKHSSTEFYFCQDLNLKMFKYWYQFISIFKWIVMKQLVCNLDIFQFVCLPNGRDKGIPLLVNDNAALLWLSVFLPGIISVILIHL